jgi:hypothetical protein
MTWKGVIAGATLGGAVQKDKLFLARDATEVLIVAGLVATGRSR